MSFFRTTAPAPLQDDSTSVSDVDARYLRKAIAWACVARARGNKPFGAMVVAGDGTVLAEAYCNSAETGDCTAHAEVNALRKLNPQLEPDDLAQATIYTSAEPCAMCAGAIFWSGIGRVVYGIDTERLRYFRGRDRGEHLLDIGCREVFAAGSRPIDCVGPALVEEASAPHIGFWHD